MKVNCLLRHAGASSLRRSSLTIQPLGPLVIGMLSSFAISDTCIYVHLDNDNGIYYTKCMDMNTRGKAKGKSYPLRQSRIPFLV